MKEASKVINEVLNKVKTQLICLMDFRRKREVTFENVKIYHESDKAILVELENQSVWWPKAKVKIERKKKTATITVPLWLIKKSFPLPKYKQFLKI